MGITQSFITEWDNTPKQIISFQRSSQKSDVIASMKQLYDHKIPSIDDFAWACGEATKLFAPLPNFIRATLLSTDRLIIVGDMHGCFETMMRLFQGNQQIQAMGYPGEVVAGKRNIYMFNGDLVDRGGSGYQIVFALCLLKMMEPQCVYVNRGNHESEMFGMSTETGFGSAGKFMGEVALKFPGQSFTLYKPAVADLFCSLPIAHLFDNNILVIHGGAPIASDASKVNIPPPSPFQMTRPLITVHYTADLTPFSFDQFKTFDRKTVRDFEDTPRTAITTWHAFVWSYDRYPYMAAFMAYNHVRTLVCSHTATPYHFVSTFVPQADAAEGWSLHSIANSDEKFEQMKQQYNSQDKDLYQKALSVIEIFSSPTNNGGMFACVIEGREGNEGQRFEVDPYLWGYKFIGQATEFKFIQTEQNEK